MDGDDDHGDDVRDYIDRQGHWLGHKIVSVWPSHLALIKEAEALPSGRCVGVVKSSDFDGNLELLYSDFVHRA